MITNLLNEYGQCAPCNGSATELSYHNSFLICDANEAWLLETAGRNWVAQKISSGYKNLCSSLTIETKFEKSSPDVLNYAKEKGLWSGEVKLSHAI